MTALGTASPERTDPAAAPARARARRRAHLGVVVLLVVGGLAYADWVLQLLLPVHADVRTSFISELSAPDQPFHAWFRVADITGGVLMVVGGAAAWVLRPRRWAVWAPLLALGLAVVVEAALPLEASMTFGSGAASAPAAGTSAWWARISEPHGVASLADSLAYLVLLVTGTRALTAQHVRPLLRRPLTVVGVTAAVLGFAQAAQTALFLIVGHAVDLGLVQRVEVGLAALWLAVVPAVALGRAPAGDGRVPRWAP